METMLKIKRNERSTWGCDGCRNRVPTQRFEGYRGDNLWLCQRCLRRLFLDGLDSKEYILEDYISTLHNIYMDLINYNCGKHIKLCKKIQNKINELNKFVKNAKEVQK